MPYDARLALQENSPASLRQNGRVVAGTAGGGWISRRISCASAIAGPTGDLASQLATPFPGISLPKWKAGDGDGGGGVDFRVSRLAITMASVMARSEHCKQFNNESNTEGRWEDGGQEESR